LEEDDVIDCFSAMDDLNQSTSSGPSSTPKKGDESSGMSIPQTRIRAIMRSSPDSLQISQEALFAMTKATVHSSPFYLFFD
jgi:hypothetical protein